MAVPGLVVLLPLILLLLAGAIVVLVVTAARSEPVPSGREERRVRLVQWVGLGLGTVAAVRVVATDPFGLGRGAVVAPMLLGLLVLLAVVVGEVVVRPRFDTASRVADLRPRTVRDHLPRLLAPTVAAVAVLGLALCAFTLATADPDDMGRVGRALSGTCEDGTVSTRSPFPGSFYVTPYAVGVLAALVVAGLAAHRITARSLGGTLEQAERHRMVGVRSVVAALGVVVAAPLTGLAFFAGWALTTHQCVPYAYGLVGLSSLVLALVAAATTIASLVTLVVPLPYAVRRPEPARA